MVALPVTTACSLRSPGEGLACPGLYGRAGGLCSHRGRGAWPYRCASRWTEGRDVMGVTSGPGPADLWPGARVCHLQTPSMGLGRGSRFPPGSSRSVTAVKGGPFLPPLAPPAGLSAPRPVTAESLSRRQCQGLVDTHPFSEAFGAWRGQGVRHKSIVCGADLPVVLRGESESWQAWAWEGAATGSPQRASQGVCGLQGFGPEMCQVCICRSHPGP